MRDLKTDLYLTVHSSKKTVEQIADEIGVSASYLYRACLEGESGCRFPLDLLLPLMQATGDYRLLDHLNARAERITVKLPRVSKLKKQDPKVVNEITQHFHEAMADVLRFFENPDRDAVASLKEKLHRHLCEVASLGHTVNNFHQKELF
ncbi:MAG TPA: helix-turn-helix transcriptional regulator [Bryobacteraceae bacterium]|nr:helix-turn-helix transcriptional regulator [Bryobacteraceae bacterium]